ncbi:unnamed protein product [Thlaspi arvense]|uniref:Uncharacterized protein n=1 Tax=Thlaspi arvense TaxID=13288 RepID=A0AAU9RH99_THLAR|nr:unnamed protein product [Thlaspi arvense]
MHVCLEKFLELALRCVNDSSVDRPKMGDVVREIENIIGLASSNLNSEPTFTSSSFDGETDGNTSHFYGSEVSVDHSRSFVPFHMEHQRGRAPR